MTLVYKDLIISTIVDHQIKEITNLNVYKDLIISTIVDYKLTIVNVIPNVYKDLIISTIVDFGYIKVYL